jgi:hypothetical protein
MNTPSLTGHLEAALNYLAWQTGLVAKYLRRNDGGRGLWLFHPRDSDSSGKLVAAGFHGDEPAGCWGVLRYLEMMACQNKQANLAFLPFVNTTGLNANTRRNIRGEDPNRGFPNNPSQEGAVLLANIEEIQEYSRNGFLTLHSDSDLTHLTAYKFGETGNEWLGDVGLDIIPDEPDGSFEDYLFSTSKAPFTFCTETPGNISFESAVRHNANFISYFAGY